MGCLPLARSMMLSPAVPQCSVIIDEKTFFVRSPVNESIRHPLDSAAGVIDPMAAEIYESCNATHFIFIISL